MLIRRDLLPHALVTFSCLLAVLVYWIGLSGPFLLDDPANLQSIQAWLKGELELWSILFGRGGGTFGRPVSMATFAINAWIGGFTPFSLKVGNLLVHLLCGLLIFFLLGRLLHRDPRLREKSQWVSAIIASLWLLHPLHASTVLYVVQRMAQLSSLIILLGLIVYLNARERLERGPSRSGGLTILVGVPLLTALGFLAKENGILLPLLCALMEFAYFQKQPRPRVVRIFIVAFVFLPIAAALTWCISNPDWLSRSYVGRDFDLIERLLSQTRALCDYIWKLVVPNPPTMGIHTDGFAVSHGLLDPPSTLIACLFLTGASLVFWFLRKRAPTLFFGWFFFLLAHALESGVIALELYFEHRNYLPSVGILLLVVSLVSLLGDLLSRQGVGISPIGKLLLWGTLVVLVAGTHGRARVWRSDLLIAESSLQAHPESIRAAAYMLGVALDHGDIDTANRMITRLTSSERPRNRSLGHAYRVFVDCVYLHSAHPEDLDSFLATAPMPVTIWEAQPFGVLYQATKSKKCAPLTDQMVGSALARLTDRATAQPDNRREKILLRYQAASYLARARDWNAALAQGKLAWQPMADAPVATPLILAQLNTGNISDAEKTLQEARTRSERGNQTDQQYLDWLGTQIERAKAAPPR